MVGMLTTLDDVKRDAGPAKPGPAGTAAAGEAPAAEGDESNASPEEQAAYERFVSNGYSIIYDEKMLPNVLNALKAGEPVESLANVAAAVAMRLEESAQKAGQPLDESIVYHGGVELLEDLAQLAERVGIHEFTPDEMEGALYRAVDLYRETKQKAGGVDREGAQEQFAALMTADASGQIDKIAPGLGERFKAAPEGKPEPEPEDEEDA